MFLTELKTERDELRRNFHASVFDVKQKSTFRSLLFEKKLSAMQRIQEEREAQLVEVLSRARTDVSSVITPETTSDSF